MSVPARYSLAAVALLAAFGMEARGQLPCQYSVTVIPDVDCGALGFTPGNPIAINNLGHVVLTADCNLYNETYLWTGGPTLTPIPHGSDILGFSAADLNNNDIICGQASMTGLGLRAAVYNPTNGQWIILDPPFLGGQSSAAAISDSGMVCGWRSAGPAFNPQNAFRWSPATSTFEDFGLINGHNTAARDINLQGVVTVSSGLAVPGAYAYVWDGNGSTIIQPPGCISSDAGRLTNSGMMTTGGIVQVNPWQTRGFVYRNGTYLEYLPLRGAASASSGGLSEAGLLSGRSNFDSTTRACVWTNGQPVDLNTLVPGFSGTLNDARISGNGFIVSRARINNQNVVVRLQPVMPTAGDTDCDGHVNVDDLLQVILNWGPCPGCRADTTGDAQVNVDDLLNVIVHWT